MGGGGGCCITHCGFCCIGHFFSSSDGGCCVGHCGVSSGSSRTPEDHATLIAHELAEMRQRSAKEAAKEENDIIDDVTETMTEFIKWIREINKQNIGGRNLNINVDIINALDEALRNKIVGFIGKKLADRLIQTDPEVSTILAERDSAKRKKNFDDFYEARKRDAIRDLIEEIEMAVRKQSESIESEIEIRLNELEDSMQQEARDLEELLKMKVEQDSRIAEKQVEYMYYESLCDIMFDELKMSSLKKGR